MFQYIDLIFHEIGKKCITVQCKIGLEDLRE